MVLQKLQDAFHEILAFKNLYFATSRGGGPGKGAGGDNKKQLGQSFPGKRHDFLQCHIVIFHAGVPINKNEQKGGKVGSVGIPF